jgi:hypothetical protein
MTDKRNGFDLGVIGALQGCIREDPERAHPRCGTTVRRLGGQRSRLMHSAAGCGGTRWGSRPSRG